MSYEKTKKSLDKLIKPIETYNYQQFSNNKYLSSQSKYNNPNLSDSSKSSSSKKDNDSSKEVENISVSSNDHSLDDSDVSISNKSEILNNLNNESEDHNDNDSLSDIENNIEQELPAKEKTTYFKSQDIKHNFSFEEKKKKEELPNSKLKYQDNTFKSYEKSKIEDLKLKYSHKKAKPSQEYENKHIQKEKRLDLVSMGPRIFIEIKQINSEIDVLEKDLEKNFKFYNKQLN